MSNQTTMPDVGHESAPSHQEVRHAASHEAIQKSFFARWSSRLFFAYCFSWKYAFAMVCTQNPLLSFLLVGWSHRFTQRAVFKRWWRFSGRDSATFDAFIASIEQTESHVTRPNWIVQHQFRDNLRRSWAEKHGWLKMATFALRALFHSLWLNAKLGVQVMFNIWVLTLPGCVFMLFAWQYGWNNSFYKGYEQAQIGPATGLFGIGLLIVAMMYAPMATARQAATENWKAFYDFRLVSRLIRRRAFRCLGLAVLFAFAALPVNLLKTAPAFMTGGGGEFAQRVEAMTADEARAFLNSYYFWASAVVVPAFLLLRVVAGRIYASALLAEIRYGKDMPELASVEREVLSRLRLLERNESRSPLVLRALGWTASRSGLAVAVVLTVIVWFTFVSQTYVSEFLNYHTEYGLAWLNHPLVQLPFFRFIPAGLSS